MSLLAEIGQIIHVPPVTGTSQPVRVEVKWALT
jgi:hypothetical protein